MLSSLRGRQIQSSMVTLLCCGNLGRIRGMAVKYITVPSLQYFQAFSCVVCLADITLEYVSCNSVVCSVKASTQTGKQYSCYVQLRRDKLNTGHKLLYSVSYAPSGNTDTESILEEAKEPPMLGKVLIFIERPLTK